MYCGNTQYTFKWYDCISTAHIIISYYVPFLSRVQMKLTNSSAPNGCPLHSSVENAVSPTRGGGGYKHQRIVNKNPPRPHPLTGNLVPNVLRGSLFTESFSLLSLPLSCSIVTESFCLASSSSVWAFFSPCCLSSSSFSFISSPSSPFCFSSTFSFLLWR